MKLASIAALLLVALARAGDTPALERFAFNEPCMGTKFRVVLYAPNEAAARAAARTAFDRIEDLDKMMTDYDESSELMKLCAQAGGAPVKVSDDLFDILSKAADFNTKTGGAFDVTIGPVVRLWRQARAEGKPPDPADIAKANELVGNDKMVLDAKTKTVQLLKPGMKVDLGGIAKGYAVDKAIELLKSKGFSSVLVSGGGDIGVADSPPGKPGWTIDIQPLDKAKRDKPVRLLLKNAGISTSGDEEQYLEIKGGKRYSHIVDPKTGKALEGHSSVTVYGPNCTASDALAKVGVKGVEAAIKTIDGIPGAAVLFVIEEKDGIKDYESKAWKDVPKNQ